MSKQKRKQLIAVSITVTVNVVLIICVVFSVIFAFSDAKNVSFSQNIENVRTLTNASASKIGLELDDYTQQIKTIAGYVNNYQGRGMTQEELCIFFDQYLNIKEESCSWQLVDSLPNGEVGVNRGFNARLLGEDNDTSFVYRSQIYEDLAKTYAGASEETIGTIQSTSEFTDASPRLEKTTGMTTTLRLKNADGYEYKTLLLLIKSAYMNEVIANNNEIDTLSYFDYSNIIVDEDANYVISNSQFQGTNFVDYIQLYNEKFTKKDAQELRNSLQQSKKLPVLYFQNNREQDCAYTIVPVKNSRWYILSIVPLASFHDEYDFNRNFLHFAMSFGMLFLVDIIFAVYLNRQLRRKTKEAQAASVAKSEFLSSMSHDIRTPMNAIIGMTLIAKESLEKDADQETLKDCVKTIELSGNHLLTLINDILDISKIENGKVVLASEQFSISESVGKMLEISQSQIKEKKLQFETHIVNVEHEYICADELRLNQVYMNILSNAIKYTNPGGKITVELREEQVQGRTDRARYIYCVKDTGIGMSEEFMKSIFERFSRAVDTRVNTTQGTGLGMSIMKQLVDLMNGSVTVESQIDVGSVFTVTLEFPLAQMEEETDFLDPLSILLIDDDPVLLKTAMIPLVKDGMTVETALNGADGIRMAMDRQRQNLLYDVIFVDWRMSVMNGKQVVGELRRLFADRVKIIVMTAYNIAEIEREVHQAGANAVVSKPLFQSKLRHVLHSLFVEKEVVDDGERQFQLQVLIAEDNDTNWKILSKILIRYGIDAERVGNGQLAVEAIQKGTRSYDLVLMDIQMPVMNGYQATEEIRRLSDKSKADIPIYAMTADTFAEDVTKCMKAGMNGHLSKPVELDKLLRVLTDIANRKDERKA